MKNSWLMTIVVCVFSYMTFVGGCTEAPVTVQPDEADLPDEATDDDNVRDNTGVCFGRVIDRSTRAGIADAVVEINAGRIVTETTDAATATTTTTTSFVGRTTTTTSDDTTTSTLFDETGMWRIEGLPTGGTYVVRIGATGYATVEGACALGGSSDDNTAQAVDTGLTALVKSATATVNLTNILTGAVVGGCPVFATPTTSGEPAASLGQSEGGQGAIDISATSDATTGAATLAGLNPLIEYTIVAPACDNTSPADGVYDFQTGLLGVGGGIDAELIDSPTTFTIALTPAQINEGTGELAIIASSCDQFSIVEDPLMPGCAVRTNGALVYVFNFPIQTPATGQLQLVLNSEATFLSSVITAAGILDTGADTVDFDGDDQTATDGAVDTAITVAMSAGNTILTVTPTAALAVNGLYSLGGTVTTTAPGDFIVGNLESIDLLGGGLIGGFLNNELIYVIPATDTSIDDPTADNYNSSDDNDPAGAGVTETVGLEFGEALIGNVYVLGFTSTVAGPPIVTTATVLQNPLVINLNTGSLVNEGDNDTGVGGDTSDGCASVTDATCTGDTDSDVIKYVVPLAGVALRDDFTTAPAQPNSVTVYVDAMDASGNVLQKELTLSIQ